MRVGTLVFPRLIPSWRTALLLLFVLGVLNGLFWIAHKKERYYDGQDSFEYRLLATNLLAGRGFSREIQAPFRPTNYREPGYPVFIAAVFAVTHDNDQILAFVQAGLLGVSAVTAALLGQAVFKRKRIAVLAGALVAICPDLGDTARYEMSEALFVPLFLLASLAGFYAWKYRGLRRGALAGVLLGLAGYARVMAMPVVLLQDAVMVVLDWRRGERRWLWAPVLAVAMLVVAAPWVARNEVVMGSLSFTGRSGGFVIPRADKTTLPLSKQVALYDTAVWAVTFPFSQVFVPTDHLYNPPNIWDGPLGDLELQETNRGFARHCQNLPEGTVEASDACQMRVGLQLIETHPWQYVYMTPLEFVRLSFYIYPSKLSVLRNWEVWIGLGVLVLCLVSKRFRTPERTWLAVAILSYTGLSILGDTQPRYGVPLIPFYVLFVSAGVVWAAEWAVRRVRAPVPQTVAPEGAATGVGEGLVPSR